MTELVTVSLAAWAIGGCRQAAVCDGTTCAPVCESLDAAQRALVPEGGDILTAYEVALLGEELSAYRERVRPLDERGFGLCRGVDACDAWLGADIADPLPPGDYIVTGKLLVPALGHWDVQYRLVCGTEKDPAPLRELTLPVVPPEQGTVVDLGVIQALHVAPAAEDEPTRCYAELTIPGNQQLTARTNFAIAGSL